MRGASSLLALTVLLAGLLAGCAGEPKADAAAPVPGGTTVVGPGAGNVTADSGALPEWHLGMSWTHRWTLRFGGQEESFDAEVVVANVTPSGYELAVDTLETALFHAAFFFPDLGTMGRDLAYSTEGDFQFPWYSFPLEDGKTWAATERNLGFDLAVIENPVTLTAELMPGADGVADHYMVQMRGPEGLRAWYDYQPDTMWFSEFRAYEGGDDLENWTYRIETVQVEPAWSGTWFRAHADLVLGYQSFTVPTAGMAPAPPQTFQLAPEHTHIQLLMFSFAAATAAGTEVVAPDGQAYHNTWVPAQAQPVAYQAIAQSQIVQREAVPGSWVAGVASADPLAGGGGAFAWGATVSQGTV